MIARMSKSRRGIRKGQVVVTTSAVVRGKVWRVQAVLGIEDIAEPARSAFGDDGALLLVPASGPTDAPGWGEIMARPGKCRLATPAERSASRRAPKVPEKRWEPDRPTIRWAERVARRTAEGARTLAREYRANARKTPILPDVQAMLRRNAREETARAEALSALADYYAWGDFDATGDLDR